MKNLFIIIIILIIIIIFYKNCKLKTNKENLETNKESLEINNENLINLNLKSKQILFDNNNWMINRQMNPLNKTGKRVLF